MKKVVEKVALQREKNKKLGELCKEKTDYILKEKTERLGKVLEQKGRAADAIKVGERACSHRQKARLMVREDIIAQKGLEHIRKTEINKLRVMDVS